jgi:hypothetical protein
MNKFKVKLLLSFGVGVLTGVFFFPLVILGVQLGANLWHLFGTVPASAIPQTHRTQQGISVEFGPDPSHGVTIRRDKEQIVISPPSGIIWQSMVFAESAGKAYVLAQKQIGHYSYTWDSLEQISLPEGDEALSKCKLLEIVDQQDLRKKLGESSITSLDGVSKNAKRLLLRINTKDTNYSSGTCECFSEKSYYYYPDDHRFEEIVP